MYLVFPLKVELAQTPHYHYHKLIQIQDYVHLDTISILIATLSSGHLLYQVRHLTIEKLYQLFLEEEFSRVALLGWSPWKKKQNYPKNLTLKIDWNPHLFKNLWLKLLTVFLYLDFDETLNILNQKSYYFSSNSRLLITFFRYLFFLTITRCCRVSREPTD